MISEEFKEIIDNFLSAYNIECQEFIKITTNRSPILEYYIEAMVDNVDVVLKFVSLIDEKTKDISFSISFEKSYTVDVFGTLFDSRKLTNSYILKELEIIKSLNDDFINGHYFNWPQQVVYNYKKLVSFSGLMDLVGDFYECISIDLNNFIIDYCVLTLSNKYKNSPELLFSTCYNKEKIVNYYNVDAHLTLFNQQKFKLLLAHAVLLKNIRNGFIFNVISIDEMLKLNYNDFMNYLKTQKMLSI